MKKFTMTVTIENEQVNASSHNDGLSGLEIIGILQMKINDIVCQMKHPSQFERILVEGGQEFKMVEEETK